MKKHVLVVMCWAIAAWLSPTVGTAADLSGAKALYAAASYEEALSLLASLEATEELKKLGTFKDGVFHRNPGQPGKKNLDGFQAIWEHLTGRALKYPKPRYDVPILMHPDNYDWVPVEGQPGSAWRMPCSRAILRIAQF